MSRLGMPDLGVATLNDMRDHAGMIASLDRSVPLIADMDAGYGGNNRTPRKLMGGAGSLFCVSGLEELTVPIFFPQAH